LENAGTGAENLTTFELHRLGELKNSLSPFSTENWELRIRSKDDALLDPFSAQQSRFDQGRFSTEN
jgi:hypothetical protein